MAFLKSIEKKVLWGKSALKNIEKANVIFVPQNAKSYKENAAIWRNKKAVITTLTHSYFWLFPGRIIGITGSNGKSTVSALVHSMCSQDKRQKIVFTGNDRSSVQCIYAFHTWKKTDTLLLEISNRQLGFGLPCPPSIGAITQIAHNHLNEYGGSFAAYKKIKLSLFKGDKRAKVAVLDADTIGKKERERVAATQKILVADTEKQGAQWWVDKMHIVYMKNRRKNKVITLDKLQVIGRHMYKNIALAMAVAVAAGVSISHAQKAAYAYKGLPQRMQILAKKGKAMVIDDSNGTSPVATKSALESLADREVALIVGGLGKDTSYAPLAIAAKKYAPKKAMCIESEAGNTLYTLFKKQGIETIKAASPKAATRIAMLQLKKGLVDTVVLSPAAAYFVYFKKRSGGPTGFPTWVKKALEK